jgi:hypothetical protein
MTPIRSDIVPKPPGAGAQGPPHPIVVFASVHGHAQTPVVVGSGVASPMRKPN